MLKNRIIKIFLISLVLMGYSTLYAQNESGIRGLALVYSNSQNDDNKLDRANDEITSQRSSIFTRTVGQCSPAIVGINVTEVMQVEHQYSNYNDPLFEYFFGRRNRQTEEYQVENLGSGFIISSDGYILTNHHVAGNASKVVVTMTDGKKYNAKIVGADMVADVCLLKIDAQNLPYMRLGNSDNILVGEWVLAFGNPFGLFARNTKPTVTVGIVSNNCVSFIQPDKPYNRIYKNMIQTDAAISSGNSGGPLVNSLGEVIGMNTIIWSTAQSNEGAGSIGIGFAIPINRVKNIVDRLIKDGSIDRTFELGMEVRDIDRNLQRYIGTNLTEAVVVYSFTNYSPAEQAGFALGDIITEIDGTKITKTEDYYLIMNDAANGDILNFKVIRDGKEVNVKLELKKAIRRYRN
ncbi:MAG: trypsin-like peptidase domain-containing protein [bacterium]